MSFGPGDVPAVAHEVVVHIPADGGDVVVFHDTHRRWYRLVGTATSIWLNIDGVRSVDEILTALAATHGVETDDILSDVLATLDELRASGMLC